MRIAVIGAGGVGGYFGALLALAGEEVTFLARGAHLAAIQTGGLELRTETGPARNAPAAALSREALSGAGPFDLVLWCVKAYQNEEVAEALDPIATEGSWWLPLQNGVQAEEFLHGRFPMAQVLGGTCYVSALLEAPGVIRHFASGLIALGEMGFSDPARTPAMIEEIRQRMETAGIGITVSQDIRRDKWRKLTWNAALNTLSALSGVGALELLAHEPTREIVREAMYEVVAVAQALGIALEKKHADRHIETTRKLPAVRTSMAWDVGHGRPIEHEALCGVVVRLGERSGVATPLLRSFYALLALYEERRLRAGGGD